MYIPKQLQRMLITIKWNEYIFVSNWVSNIYLWVNGYSGIECNVIS